MTKMTVGVLCAVVGFFVIFVSSATARSYPDEARRHMARGEEAVETAKSADDYENAIREFQEAARLAPSWPDPHYNLGIVQDKAGKVKEAISSLKTYLRLSPDAPDAEKVKDLIYKLEYRAERLLTVHEIIEVLVTLSDERIWGSQGSCNKEKIGFRQNDFAEDSYVAAMTSYRAWEGRAFYGAKLVEGNVLKYQFVTHKYPPGECAVPATCCDDACLSWEEREIEVVTKNLVRVKQRLMRNVPRGKPEAGIVAAEKACTFRRK